MENNNSSNAKTFEELRLKDQQIFVGETQDRRYVGSKETLGFVIWDAAQSFNINIFSKSL